MGRHSWKARHRASGVAPSSPRRYNKVCLHRPYSLPPVSRIADASPTDLALSNTLGACLAAAAPFTEGYIWQKEPFSLSVTPAAGSGDNPPAPNSPHLLPHCSLFRVASAF